MYMIREMYMIMYIIKLETAEKEKEDCTTE